MYSVELNDQIRRFTCPDCGEECLTVWGFVAKDSVAHAIYYAGLMTGHDQPSVRLAISIGGWGIEHSGENNVDGRSWVFVEARPTADRYEIMVREPEESIYFNKPILGKPMSRAEALASPLLGEFFGAGDFICFNDPAVKSYLLRQDVSASGRKGMP
jgi:hypothetical protein